MTSPQQPDLSTTTPPAVVVPDKPALEGLEAMSERIGSKDISWTVKAIRIQHQTGGKLADTLGGYEAGKIGF